MRPLQVLARMAQEEYARKHPDIPTGWLPNQKFKQSTANEVTKAVITFIRLSGGQAERISVTGRRVDQRHVVTDALGFKRQIGSVKWIKSSMQVGTADISATIRGRSVKIEVKVGKDRQSEKQKEYQRQVEQAGGVYLIVRSFDEFYEWWKNNDRNGND